MNIPVFEHDVSCCGPLLRHTKFFSRLSAACRASPCYSVVSDLWLRITPSRPAKLIAWALDDRVQEQFNVIR